MLAPELRAALDAQRPARPLRAARALARARRRGPPPHRGRDGADAARRCGIEHPTRCAPSSPATASSSSTSRWSSPSWRWTARRGVPGSPVLTAIARNGVEVGIRVSGTGDRWFVGPAALPDPAKLFDGYAPADMNPDLGDSAIVETYGLGALAVAASPAAAASVGIDAADDRRHRRRAACDRGRRVAGHALPRRPRGDARHRRPQGRRDAHRAARAHRHRAQAARRRPDRRRRHAPAAEAFDLAVDALDAR